MVQRTFLTLINRFISVRAIILLRETTFFARCVCAQTDKKARELTINTCALFSQVNSRQISFFLTAILNSFLDLSDALRACTRPFPLLMRTRSVGVSFLNVINRRALRGSIPPPLSPLPPLIWPKEIRLLALWWHWRIRTRDNSFWKFNRLFRDAYAMLLSRKKDYS